MNNLTSFNKNIILKTKNSNWKNFKIDFKNFFKESILFILFALFNGLIPILICLIVSAIKIMGTQYTMSIGYITAIQLGFIQLSWSITLGIFYAFFKEKKLTQICDLSQIFAIIFMITFIYATIVTPIFFASSYIYNYYASAHINTIFGQEQAYYYIYTIWIYVFINSFIYSLIIYIHMFHSKILANISLILYSFIIIGFCALFTLLIHSNYTGLLVGISMSIGSIISFIILCLYMKFKLKVNFKFYKEYWNYIGIVLKDSYKQLLIIVTIQIFKAIALICLGVLITETIESIVPISYQLSRVIWYNLLYMLPFLGYGLADAILYYGIKIDNELNYNSFNQLAIVLFFISITFSILFSIGYYFLIPEFAKFYLINNDPIESLKHFDINNINLVNLLTTLLKKESFVETLKQLNKEQILKILNQIPNIQDKEAIKTLIANTIIDYKTQLINPVTRPNAINKLVNLIEKNPETSLGVKWFFAVLLQDAQPSSVINMFDVNSCNTFYFMVTWTSLYSSSLILNNAKIIIRRNTINVFETILTIIVQGGVIAGIVSIGVTQQYNNLLPMYDAWTMPLCVTGICVFIYYLITYIVQYLQIKKSHLKNNLN